MNEEELPPADSPAEEEDTNETSIVIPVESGVLGESPYTIHLQTRERTPDVAVQQFDGTFQAVRAREVRTRTCTRQLVNFIIAFVICFSALGSCLIMLAVNGFEQPGAQWLQAIAAFCLGVFLPNPRVNKER